MPFAIDTTKTCDWARRVLRSTIDELPDDTLSPFLNTPLRRMVNLWPQLVTAGGSDLSGLSSDDLDIIAEALGWIIAARWIALPVTEEEQIIVRAKIGALEAVFKVQEPMQFIALFMLEGFNALFVTSVLAPVIQAIRQQFGGGLSGFYGVSPARQLAKENPSAPGALNNLFAPRENLFVSPYGYPPTITTIPGVFPTWAFPSDWQGWLIP